MEVQTAKGRFIEDEFFSDKPEKRQFLVRQKIGFKSEGIQEESITASGIVPCDSAMLQTLAGPDGAHAARRVFGRPGALCV